MENLNKPITTQTIRRLPPPPMRTRWLTHALLIVICFFITFPALYSLQVATLDINQSVAFPPILFPPGGEREDLADYLSNPFGDLPKNVRVLFGETDVIEMPDSDGNVETREIVSGNDFGQLIANTSVIAGVIVIGKTILALFAGLAFVYFRFPGKWVLFFFVLLTLLMPTEIILGELRRMMAPQTGLGWAESNPKLALTMPFLASAIGAFLFRQHFSNIPRELSEAAQIDGASSVRFLFAVLVPMSWNVIAAHALIQFIATWNQYIWPEFLLNDVNSPEQMIQVGVVRVAAASGRSGDYGLLMTAGIVASIPPLILFILLQKQFMNGFALTKDK